ncbi:helix-turn-helix domain-containing protein [Pseudomonas syringae]|uniref:Helix-turn-helix domain-containing protein n=3 Tax=Pseudomonas syringae group TaxID=136849 RepID=A0A9Q4A863_PSESX|nr:helix-turn-helix domain-containing protein [Pseudomonas syringae]KTB56538.1 transcriptional regulator [Pseudomonas viridiflava ICMP 13104]AHG43293.1 transcriptional regulator [Pseudomonas syringae CC1557]KTB79725.1 transcriptional regulator [Pseudomonas syringae pv. syringae PD2766]MCF5469826.1 helix-turn-helix domain-containing protein [Pseudomonas syringae]MCF5475351.1 helix-turn-helix domain-containing protein [Pseudomonas syringae]
MAGKKFSALREKMSPEAQARGQEKFEQLRDELDLAELRRARMLSQESLAQLLQVSQGSVAKMEKRTDMYISTVRRFIEAMGGELIVTARFPDHAIRITQFSDLGKPKD